MSCKWTTADPMVLWLHNRETSSPNGTRDARGLQPVKGANTLAKIFGIALVVITGAAMAPPVAAEVPADFIRTLGDQALAVMRSDAPLERKAAYFHQMLRRDFDLTGMSRFVLGPYWRVASAAQRQEFRSLLEDYIVRFDGVRLARYGGEDFQVTGSRSDPAGVIVTSRIIRPQGPPITIDWQLATGNGFYRISDLAIEGISMVMARRSEFAAVIEREGGQLEGLLALMRRKTGHPAIGPHRSWFSRSSSGSTEETAQSQQAEPRLRAGQ